MNDLEKRLLESKQMRLEANANTNAKVELLEEQVIQLKDLLEQQSTQMEQQAIRVEALMAQMMVYMTPREAGKKKKTAQVA
jgi:division protein CdvB (Snf7/Vps24/ESCRT-III family)